MTTYSQTHTRPTQHEGRERGHTTGIPMGGLAGVAGIFDFLLLPRAREHADGWIHAVGNILALVVAIANVLIRLPSPTTSPGVLGVGLSALTFGIVTGWFGGELVFRHMIADVTVLLRLSAGTLGWEPPRSRPPKFHRPWPPARSSSPARGAWPWPSRSTAPWPGATGTRTRPTAGKPGPARRPSR